MAILTTNKQARKDQPLVRGLLDYFPNALAEVAYVSVVGNKQHNGDEPLHWARHKSDDHADSAVRHLIERGTLDVDGVRHTAKAAWRVLALLQLELEADRPAAIVNGEPVDQEEAYAAITYDDLEALYDGVEEGTLVEMVNRNVDLDACGTIDGSQPLPLNLGEDGGV